jgi:hypothetical protein
LRNTFHGRFWGKQRVQSTLSLGEAPNLWANIGDIGHGRGIDADNKLILSRVVEGRDARFAFALAD